VLAVCSADNPSATIETPNPGTVVNLAVGATTDATVTLSFTQVDNGVGQPANYDIRYAVAPMSWASAVSAVSGTCASPVTGTAVGSTLSCTILGLSPSTSYNFQAKAFRGTMNGNAVFGGFSNIAAASTLSATAPDPVVTTVTVSPTSASVVAGATTPLQATVKDQNGSVMTGQTVTWSSSNTAAATVNASGVVTGVAAGSATITAMSAGKSGTSSITVTASSGSGTILFQENFEDTNLSSRSWYDNTSVLLSTAEHTGAGSVSSAQYRFLAGATTPTTGGAQRHKFSASNSVYISYNLKYTANWVGSNQLYHPHEIYVMSNMDGDYDGPSNAWMTLYLEHSYQNGGKPRLMMQDNKSVNSTLGTPPYNLVGVTENRSTGGCNGMAETNMASECFMQGYWFNDKAIIGPVVLQPNPGPGYKNDWNFVEAYFQLNTVVGGIGQADGVMQYWFNGTLIIDRHDILYRTGTHPTLQFNQFLIAPYIGDGSPVDQSMFIDNLTVATGRIP
jgi:hypothetical protein